MGRKVCLKKIENVTRCQVTFSKRRSSLVKKAQEISICCDTDVALVAFSPSGRISRFSIPERIEEVIDRYVNLPAEMRFDVVDNVQEKLERLRQLDHIKGDISKLQYLDKQLENLELHIQKSALELQIMEADIRVYEPQEQEPTLNQLLWTERNIKHSLEKVIARKSIISVGLSLPQGKNNIQMQMSYNGVTPFLNNFSARDPNGQGSNRSLGKLPVQLDPWFSRHSAKIRESLLQSIIEQENQKYVGNQGKAISTNYCIRDISERIQAEFPLKIQLPLRAQETRFVPPVQNAFRSATRCDLEIPSWSVFGNRSFSQSLHDVQPQNLERHTSLPLDKDLFTNSSFNNFQIAKEKTQASNDQIFPVSGQLNIRTNELNGNDITYPTNFFNKNNHNSGIFGSICEIGNYIPTLEVVNPPPAWLSDKSPLEDMMNDYTPQASHSQGEESAFPDRNWDPLTFEDLNDLLD